MLIANVDDVAVSLGRPITDTVEVAQVNQWLRDADLLIKVGLGATKYDALDPQLLALVTREAVVLLMRGSGGLESRTESIDDWSETQRFRTENDTQRVKILPEWWAMLSPAARDAEAFTIRPNGAWRTPGVC